MQKKALALIMTGLCWCKFIIASPDSTSRANSAVAESFTAPTTITGIFDPLAQRLDDGKKFYFLPYTDFYTGSNCFSVSFIQNFFGSGFITQEMKNDATAKLSPSNTIGIEYAAGLWTMIRSKNDNNSFFIAGVDYNFSESSKFTSDLFHVVMYGNYDLQDYTADFSGSKFSLTSTMEYKIGMMKFYDRGASQFKFGFTGGLVQGLSGLDINVQHTTMYTAVDGRYLDLDYDFRIFTSGESKPDLAKFNGAGFGADFFGSASFVRPEIDINVMLNDLGVVFWDKDPFKITGDSSLIFEGINIDNFFAATDSTFQEGNSDSLLEILGVQKEENVFSQALPMRMNVSATKKWKNAGGFVTLGTQYIFNTPYTPLIFVQGGKSFRSSGLTLAMNAHVGGYGNFNVGLDITKSFFNTVTIKLGSNSLLGIIAPDSFTGAAAYAAAAIRL